MNVSLEMWVVLGVVVVAMLAADFVVFGRGRERIPVRDSAIWSLGWLAIALAFGGLLWMWYGGQVGSEYLAGYLLERSLSLDNVFVFAVIFSYFAVPMPLQPRVLAWGIALALVLRLVFILIGAALLAMFHVTFYVFGALLLYTAWKLFRHDDTAEVDPAHNPALKLLRRHVPLSPEYQGRALIVRQEGRRVATPLVAVLVVVATTDVVFAVDSIPAIFAITQEPYIVFAANAFAMLGLRALYFLLVGAMDRLAYLSYGLAAILAFIGVKMLLIDVWHPPIWISLAVIVGVLSLTAAISLVRRRVPEPLDEQTEASLDEQTEASLDEQTEASLDEQTEAPLDEQTEPPRQARTQAPAAARRDGRPSRSGGRAHAPARGAGDGRRASAEDDRQVAGGRRPAA